ncbi:uncharacterized protein LOC109540501 isoform X1 [Dendroctonus ponderosae]|uniref:ascorbate ferrireductase (transmembrane) n=1 Tax=Dendroctonus ponderosae TaxID=77166 RepID=U4U913_DENPD|nr:uncharacterized protein LOC109540501 isoform X1 [Dendroctonus ponderosae]ERL89552.1 hypothetical protein D910_06917 [Dendroctonus ponderosae]KAH1015127.1 hypothetical protein HUJ05_012905 [Dendroctonus ponderosae]
MSDNEIIPKNQRLFLITQGCFHILMGIFVASTVWLMAYNRDWGSMHTWHVFLSTIGFALLMAEAVAMQNPGNGFFLGYGKIARGFLHGVLMLLATTAVLAGVSIKIQDKALNNRSHFTTTHGIVGFVSYLLTMLSFLGGILLFFVKLVLRICNLRPIYLRKCHTFLGISAYALGIVSLCFGLRNYFSEASYHTNTGFIVILGTYTGLNLIGPVKNLFSP